MKLHWVITHNWSQGKKLYVSKKIENQAGIDCNCFMYILQVLAEMCATIYSLLCQPDFQDLATNNELFLSYSILELQINECVTV